MPIFEYKCNKCNSKFEMLFKSSSLEKDVVCPECLTSDVRKVISRVAFKMPAVASMTFTDPGCSDGSCSSGSGFESSGGGCCGGACSGH